LKNLLYFSLLFCILLAGCDVEEPVSVSKEEQQETKQETPKQTFKVKDVVKIGSRELIVKSAKLTDGDAFNRPKRGKVLELEIQGRNLGNSPWILTEFDFNCYDKSGSKLESYFSDEISQLGEINQGKTVSGKLFFDAPDERVFELVYRPNAFTGQEVKFNIQLN